MNNTAYAAPPLHRWMSATPEIDNLSLFDLTLPGTHNAGCDGNASYALIPGKNWTACQDVTFYSQLNLGSRALDVRLEYHSKAKDFSQFRFQHSGFLSSRNLGDLLRDLNKFLGENPDEFIILDFHELKPGDSAFNFTKFKELMIQHLGDRMIPSYNMYKSLAALKLHPLQRVYVAASLPWDIADDRFQQRIPHHWHGGNLVSTNDLYKFVAEVVSQQWIRRDLWSLSATTFTLGGPQRILGELDDWFSPAKSDWAKKCNIINFDFIKDSNIVFHCQSANIEKANEKSNVQPRALTE